MQLIWIIGVLFTCGFLSGAKRQWKKEHPDGKSPLSNIEWIAVGVMTLFAWPYIIGGVIGMRLEESNDGTDTEAKDTPR